VPQIGSAEFARSGGVARARKLTPAERSASAKKAVDARIAQKRARATATEASAA